MVVFVVVIGLAQTTCSAGPKIIDADFSKGDFAALGWKAKGDWDVFQYPNEAANNPGPVARFAANKPDGSLTKTFDEIKNPKKLTLSLDYGWGWGDAGQAADAVSFMLLDAKGNGYVFEVHRCKANWAVQWAKVADGAPAKDKTWAPEEIDASHASVRDGGGLSRLTITRESDGAWTHRQQGLEQGRRRDGEVHRHHDDLVQPAGAAGDPELRRAGLQQDRPGDRRPRAPRRRPPSRRPIS